ncbi:MAG TPA: hypothetical protein VFB92_16160 [Vicinamibacterales bacterium]|jgi:hypothetical protein|nr:hypothetical protein [Vicinamibacterales bacterium]
MKYLLPAVLIVSAAALAAQEQEQERKVPNDSQRITVPGCAKGRTFIVAAREGHEPTSGELAPGRRFRLSGDKDILKEIEKREGMMVQVTGLVRKADLAGPGGISTGGGRVRIGGGAPQSQVGGGPASGTLTGVKTDAVLDVEGWDRLPESCPSR